MLLLRIERLPEAEPWLYELKLDGYRAIAAKSKGKVLLWSRNENDFGVRYTAIADAVAPLPDDTVVDGEIVALDDDGKPSFSALQNYGSAKASLVYYLFDVPALNGRDLRGLWNPRGPRVAEQEALARAFEEARKEKVVRKALENGVSAKDAFEKFGIL